MYITTHYIFHLVTTVSFDQSAYSFNENVGLVQIALVLSNPSSDDITIQVKSSDNTAQGHYH